MIEISNKDTVNTVHVDMSDDLSRPARPTHSTYSMSIDSNEQPIYTINYDSNGQYGLVNCDDQVKQNLQKVIDLMDRLHVQSANMHNYYLFSKNKIKELFPEYYK